MVARVLLIYWKGHQHARIKKKDITHYLIAEGGGQGSTNAMADS